MSCMNCYKNKEYIVELKKDLEACIKSMKNINQEVENILKKHPDITHNLSKETTLSTFYISKHPARRVYKIL